MKLRDEKRHPGITMHAIPVAGVGGLLFMVGAAAVVLLGIPAARWFLAGAVALGFLFFLVLRATSKSS